MLSLWTKAFVTLGKLEGVLCPWSNPSFSKRTKNRYMKPTLELLIFIGKQKARQGECIKPINS